MRLVLISDTHGQHRKLSDVLPEGDVLVHAGDLTMQGELSTIADFDFWLDGLHQFKHKVVIAGNHDLSFHFREPKPVLHNCHYLQDSLVTIDGVNFYGSPWTPQFGYGWAFNADSAKMERVATEMPHADVIVTHGPVYGMHDLTLLDRVHAGCPHLRDAIRKLKPKVHVCGHIHEGYGANWTGETAYVNASSVNFDYRLVNPPVVFDLK